MFHLKLEKIILTQKTKKAQKAWTFHFRFTSPTTLNSCSNRQFCTRKFALFQFPSIFFFFVNYQGSVFATAFKLLNVDRSSKFKFSHKIWLSSNKEKEEKKKRKNNVESHNFLVISQQSRIEPFFNNDWHMCKFPSLFSLLFFFLFFICCFNFHWNGTNFDWVNN